MYVKINKIIFKLRIKVFCLIVNIPDIQIALSTLNNNCVLIVVYND